MTKCWPRIDFGAHRRELLVGIIMIIGIVTLLVTNAATNVTSFFADNSTKSGNVGTFTNSSSGLGRSIKFGTPNVCGRSVVNYSYQVPFGNAVWNQPVCNLPTYSKSADFANRLVKWAVGDNPNLYGTMDVSPGFPDPTQLDPLINLFTREVYLASKATTEAKVASIGSPSNLDGVGYNSDEAWPSPGKKSQHPEATIPWNPNWKTGKGGDNEIFILDDRPGPTQGRIYTIWIFEAGGCFNPLELLVWPNRVCGTSIQVGRDHYGNYVDYRTHEGYVSERGVGLSYYATLTTPEEVAAGEIRHALGIAVANTSFGTICSAAQLGTAAESNTCGTALAPASKFEWGGLTIEEVKRKAPYAAYGNDKTIPEGTRFALNMTYAQIDAWVASRTEWANNPRRAQTARIFARAMKDYGMIVVDTNGTWPGVQMAGGVNPDNATKWKNLAMGPEWDGRELLKGLMNTSNVRVIEPPTLTCANGTTSKNYCEWINARY